MKLKDLKNGTRYVLLMDIQNGVENLDLYCIVGISESDGGPLKKGIFDPVAGNVTILNEDADELEWEVLPINE